MPTEALFQMRPEGPVSVILAFEQSKEVTSESCTTILRHCVL